MLTINTTFVIDPNSLENNRRAKTACSTISAVDRCFLKPILQDSKSKLANPQHMQIKRGAWSQQSCKMKVGIPASVAELTIHSTTHLTGNTNCSPPPTARNHNCFYHQPVFQSEQNLQPPVNYKINEDIPGTCGAQVSEICASNYSICLSAT